MNCTSLYEPNPDIAGIGIILSLAIHAGVYIFLGMFVAPYIHLFFSQITPVRRSDEDDPLGAKREARRNLLFSECRAAIVDSFGNQYIVELSFVIAGFITRKDMSYYHIRMIHTLASVTLASAAVSFYVRETMLRRTPEGIDLGEDIELEEMPAERPAPSFQRPSRDPGLLYVDASSQQSERRRSKSEDSGEVHELDSKKTAKKWSSADFRLYVCVIFYAAFTIYAGVVERRDPRFNKCLSDLYTRGWSGWTMYGVTTSLAAVTSFCAVFALFLAGRSSAFAWIATLLSSSILVLYSTGCIIRLRKAFQPSGRLDTESQFGFGQILVFFMIFQLAAEFCGAMAADFAKLDKDLVLLQPELELTNFEEKIKYFARTFWYIMRTLVPMKLRELWVKSEHYERLPLGTRLKNRYQRVSRWVIRIGIAINEAPIKLFKRVKGPVSQLRDDHRDGVLFKSTEPLKRFLHDIRHGTFLHGDAELTRANTLMLESQAEVMASGALMRDGADLGEPATLSRRGTARSVQEVRDTPGDAESVDSLAITSVASARR